MEEGTYMYGFSKYHMNKPFDHYSEKTKGNNMVIQAVKHYLFDNAGERYADGAIRHLSLKLSLSNTPMLPSIKVA